MKLFTLGYLLYATRQKTGISPKQCTHFYHLTEAVGRWSMVDVFVVTVLVAIVQLEPFAVIKAGSGIGYFAAVVLLTMLAAHCFEPQLLWLNKDSFNQRRNKQ